MAEGKQHALSVGLTQLSTEDMYVLYCRGCPIFIRAIFNTVEPVYHVSEGLDLNFC